MSSTLVESESLLRLPTVLVLALAAAMREQNAVEAVFRLADLEAGLEVSTCG